MKTYIKHIFILPIFAALCMTPTLHAQDEDDGPSEKDVLSFVEKNFPRVFKEIKELQNENDEEAEEEYEMMLEEAAEVYEEYHDMKNFNAAAAQALLDMHRTEFEAYELADKEGVNRDKLLPIIKKHIQARFIYETAALDLAEKEIKAEREQLAKEKAKADQLAEDILKMLQEDLDEDEDEMDDEEEDDE